jgi:hypothetical protein
MTVTEKREQVQHYCDETLCCDCVLSDNKGCSWCTNNDIDDCDEEVLDEALKVISESTEPTKDKVAEQTEPAEPVEDKVNHPNHYTQGIECIDEMVMMFGVDAVMTFCKLNVWKYRKRALHKNGQEDLDKSDWYVKKYQELQRSLGYGA